MKKIKYELLPDVAGQRLAKEGNLPEFARDTKWIFRHKNIPPLKILNDALLKGYTPREAEWEPFQISNAEYAELNAALLANPSERYKQSKPPKEIETYGQWERWLEATGY